MPKDSDSAENQARRRRNAKSYAEDYRKKNIPDKSTTGVYDVALRSGPGAPAFPYGPPNGPSRRGTNWRQKPRVGGRTPPQSERRFTKGGRTPPRSGLPRSESAPKRARGASWGALGGESSTGPMRSSKGGWVVPSHNKGSTIRLSENSYSAPRKNRGPKSEQRFNIKRAASNRLKRG